MAVFRHPVELGPKNGSRFQRVIATVDSGNTYTVMPSPLLEMLGIDPEWTDTFEDADVKEVECSMAEIRVRIDEQERTTVCVFGKADGQTQSNSKLSRPCVPSRVRYNGLQKRQSCNAFGKAPTRQR